MPDRLTDNIDPELIDACNVCRVFYCKKNKNGRTRVSVKNSGKPNGRPVNAPLKIYECLIRNLLLEKPDLEYEDLPKGLLDFRSVKPIFRKK